jgi:hypothetical protein
VNRLILFAAVLSACSAPTSYRQAAPAMVPMRPPAVRPVHSAPTFAQPRHTPAGAGASHGGLAAPGTSSAGVPRAEGRILPTSDEPGLWAAEPPKASASYWETIAGVPLPLPETANSKEAERPTYLCGMTMNDTIKQVGVLDRIRALTEKNQRCLAARLYLHCAKGLVTVVEVLAEGNGDFKVRHYRQRLYAVGAAEKFEASECDGGARAYTANLFSTITKQWNTLPGVSR